MNSLVGQKEAISLVNEWAGLNMDFVAVEAELDRRWYKKLREEGIKPFEMYKHKAYVYSALGCYCHMSRGFTACAIKAIHELRKSHRVESVVDYGGGCGFTSLALRREFRDTSVWYVDVKGGASFRFARWMFEKERETILMLDGEEEDVKGVDLFLSFENFEHFEEPVKELDRVLGVYSPKFLVYSSSFTIDAAGHFDEYFVDGESAGKKRMPSRFRHEVEKRGYSEIDFRFWNHRPLVFARD